MSDTSLRVRSISEIVDAAFALYRRNGMQYVTMAAIASAPSIILSLVLSGGATPVTLADLSKVVPGALISVITYALVSATIVRMGSDAYLGSEPEVAATVRAVLPRVPTLIGATILSTMAVSISFVFLFVPVPVIVLEGEGAIAAMARSARLSAGIKWHILGTLALVYGIYFVLTLGIPLLAAVLGSAVIRLVIQSVFSVVAAPILNLVVMVLYYDARIRAEGFDVEHMAQSLGTKQAPTL